MQPAKTPAPLAKVTLSHYLLLAFIAMATLAYLNYLPALVNALAADLGFTDAEAGQIVAANGYGALAGSAAAIYLVSKLRWQAALLSCLALLGILELSSVLADNYYLMLSWRFLAGIVGGLGLGIAFSVLARLPNPDRAFGLLLLLQFTTGSLVIYLLPLLSTLLGANAVFYAGAALAVIGLLFLRCLPAISLQTTAAVVPASAVRMRPVSRRRHAVLLLLAIALYQTAASAIWAYASLIGQSAGLADAAVNSTLAISGLTGLLGALLPVLSGSRFGRLNWLLSGIALSALSALLLTLNLLPTLALGYGIALALLFLCWPAVVSFMLAVSAELDHSGRLATVAALVSSVGLASGPLFGAALLGDNFLALLYSCAALFLLSYLLLFKPVRAQEQSAATVLPCQ